MVKTSQINMQLKLVSFFQWSLKFCLRQKPPNQPTHNYNKVKSIASGGEI